MSANGGGDLTRRPFVGLTVKSWPEALRYCRLERGRNYTEIGKATKTPPDRLRAWEYGKGSPDRATLRLLYQDMPKLRNFAFLLPDELKHHPHEEPTGEQAAPEVAAATVAGQTEEQASPSKIGPVELSGLTFGQAMEKLIKREGMIRREFAELALISTARIDQLVRDPDPGLTQATYDKFLSLLPDLARAPLPRIVSHATPPGRKPGAAQGRSASARDESKAAKLARVRGVEPPGLSPPSPPSPSKLVTPTTWAAVGSVPVTANPSAPLAAPAAAPASELVTDAADVQRLTEELNRHGAAFGLATATMVRLRRSMALCEAQIREHHEAIRLIALRLGVVTE
jgi:transcriptional regulator with XRE-family HTH domain